MLLALLLVFVVVRYWSRLEVRLAALGSVLVAILSMGITIHIAGKATPIPVFVIGLVFPLLRRYLPGWLMLSLAFFGWVALSRFPVLANIQTARLMLYFYLLAGLLIAVWLDDIRAWQPRLRWSGWLAAAASLVLPPCCRPAITFDPRKHPCIFHRRRSLPNPGGKRCALVVPYSVSGRCARHGLAATGGHAVSDAGGICVHPGRSATRVAAQSPAERHPGRDPLPLPKVELTL